MSDSQKDYPPSPLPGLQPGIDDLLLGPEMVLQGFDSARLAMSHSLYDNADHDLDYEHQGGVPVEMNQDTQFASQMGSTHQEIGQTGTDGGFATSTAAEFPETMQQQDLADGHQIEGPPTSQLPMTASMPGNTFLSLGASFDHLGRKVTFIPNAQEIVLQTMVQHCTLVEDVMERFTHRSDTLAYHLKDVNNSWQSRKELLMEEAFVRVSNLQHLWIEPLVGQFNDNDMAHVHKFTRFENRLLVVMYIGLTKQEANGMTLDDADAKEVLDMKGSCCLEARVWQLEMLRDWSEQLEDAIQNLGGLVLDGN